uniref:Putative acetyl-CoA synthetase (ADP-forming) alpha and beta chains n=1 Tax=Haliea sp. ETY-M TaxID=1055105 RepID=A0A455R1Y5_9GAMM|nr:putative acetyl-CoA synthetase (ADP-forming) alpha and beta chains [Haliea sp. ETY-M]
MNWFTALAQPTGVALIGASDTQGKAGRLLMDNLANGCDGGELRVFPINPRKAEILGQTTYPSVAAIGSDVDLAVILLPAARVADAIADCGRAGVATAIVISGGFSEVGPDGAAHERAMLDAAAAHGVRVIGPNCFGFVNCVTGLNASISAATPHAGGISIVTQSGAYGMSAVTRSQRDHIGFAKVISLGNCADVNETDVLAALGDDGETRVVCMLLESIQGGRHFFEVLSQTTARKPVVVLKTGKSSSGQRAAQSHTAALSGDVAVLEAGLRQAGAHVVDDGDTLFEVAHSLLLQPAASGRRVGIISNSGGVGVELTDLLEREGMLVPELSAGLQEQLRALIPAHGSSANPIDITTDWSRFAQMYRSLIDALLASDEVDVILPVLLHRSAQMPEVIDAVVAAGECQGESAPDKSIHACWVAPASADEHRLRVVDSGIPCHVGPHRTATVIARTLRRERGKISSLPVPVGPGTGEADGPGAPDASDGQEGWADAHTVYRFLDEAGFPAAPWARVSELEGGVAHAERCGYPVVIKALRKDLLHKSDAGAVVLNIRDAESLRSTFRALEQKFQTRDFLVQKQIEGGIELVIGARRDPQLGPVIVAGLGGTLIELFRDVAIRLAPVTAAEALQMLDELRFSALLDGYRGSPAVQRAACAELIAAVSRWFAERPALRELDFNPVIASGTTFTIVDARIRTSAQAPS